MEEIKSTTEAAKQLGIGASTLRKYAAALEEQGMCFSVPRINQECSVLRMLSA